MSRGVDDLDARGFGRRCYGHHALRERRTRRSGARSDITDHEGLARTFAAAGDPVRLRLLRYLLEEEHCVARCTDEVGLSQSGVSKHLAKLVDAGLVRRRQVGRRAYHRVVQPELVAELLRVARQLRGR
jgi:DNA-binding transcriptional ArsR family regulator